jgi:cytoskeletal protein RodZ
MESPGKYLKAERELRNLSLEEVAKFTKIRENFLRNFLKIMMNIFANSSSK